jgi:glycogen operon protein
LAERTWHGIKLGQPDWSPASHTLALLVEAHGRKLLLYLIVNGYWEPLDFELPPACDGNCWRRWIDTSLESPNDIVEWQTAPSVPASSYSTGPRSVIVLYADEKK